MQYLFKFLLLSTS